MTSWVDYSPVGSLIVRLVIGWLAAAIVMVPLWTLGRRRENYGIVDVGWAGLVAGLGVLHAAAGSGPPWRRAVAALMVGVWGTRLAAYLLLDRVAGRPEDRRYTALRIAWGRAADHRFFWFFQAQGAAAALFTLPTLLAASNAAPVWSPAEWLAMALWTIGVAGETTADEQLRRFKASSSERSRTCRVGLWRYSRHPNYFFEWIIWVALALFAFPAPHGAAGWICPLILLYLLFRVTGIPATEAQALRSRGDDYRVYQTTTSVFVPWFPKRAPRS